MTIPPRTYSLPNCTLVLEGIATTASPNLSGDSRPLMSMLTNAECQITGHDLPLRGGLEFFQSLVIAVSRYAQQFLSDVAIPEKQLPADALVTLTNLSTNCHRLTVAANQVSDGQGQPSTEKHVQQFDLTTVQLFDLLEAIDQFLADTSTLPGISVELAPLSKHHLPNNINLVEQSAPALIGISGLALVAFAFFIMPNPEVQRPKELTTPTQPTPDSVEPGSADSNRSPLAGVTVPSPGAAKSPTSIEPGASPSPRASSASPPATNSDTITEPKPVNAEAAFTAPEITDDGTLTKLRQTLYTALDEAWKTKPTFTSDLTYRVAVGKDGAIVGYRALNEVSSSNIDQLPLLGLLYLPTTGGQVNPEAIAQFKVVFKPNGVLEVGRWTARPASPALKPSPSPSP